MTTEIDRVVKLRVFSTDDGCVRMDGKNLIQFLNSVLLHLDLVESVSAERAAYLVESLESAVADALTPSNLIYPTDGPCDYPLPNDGSEQCEACLWPNDLH